MVLAVCIASYIWAHPAAAAVQQAAHIYITHMRIITASVAAATVLTVAAVVVEPRTTIITTTITQPNHQRYN